MSSGYDSAVIRVFVIAAVRLYREGIAYNLRREDGFEVAGTARTAADALVSLPSAKLDVALIDVAVAGSLELARTLRDTRPEVRVVALAVPEAEREVIACAEAGAAGFVTLDGSYDDLKAMLRSVTRGETLCSPQMAAVLLRRVATLAAGSRGGLSTSLTVREREIIELVERGLSNKEIARELHIELPTVKNHVHNILEKLQVRRRADAAARFRGTPLPSSASRGGRA